MTGLYSNVIADSSFFILFLNDINSPSYLTKIVKRYKFIVTPRIKEEITKKEENKRWLELNGEQFDERTASVELEKLFSPFISKNEELYKKGEYEIICLAYILKDDIDFLLIIDDDDARRLIKSHLPDLENHLCYTTKFIEICTCETRIFNKSEALHIIKKMSETRKFRIKQNILAQIEDNIRRW